MNISYSGQCPLLDSGQDLARAGASMAARRRDPGRVDHRDRRVDDPPRDGLPLIVEVIGVGGFLVVQVVGVVGRAGRSSRGPAPRGSTRQQLDDGLRGFYRREAAIVPAVRWLHFVGWLIGAAEASLILKQPWPARSPVTATVLEAWGLASASRPSSCPPDSARSKKPNAASVHGLRLGRQRRAGFHPRPSRPSGGMDRCGVAIPVAMDAPRFLAGRRLRPVPSGGD